MPARQALRKTLRRAGNLPETVRREGEGHGWLKAQTRLDVLRRIEAFSRGT